jgi:hypothetical protein
MSPCRQQYGTKRIAKRGGGDSNIAMKIHWLLIGLIATSTRLALAADTNNAAPLKISAPLAAQHYDQLMTVTGMVAQVTERPKLVFINLDQPYPDSPFVAIIFSSATNQFANLKSLKGRAVEITGTVKNYHDKPEIVVDKPGQLSVDGRPYASGTKSGDAK